MSFLAQIEQKVDHKVEADFKQKLRKAIVPIFLLLNPACGAQREQPGPNKNTDPATDTSSQDSGSGSDSGSDSSQPSVPTPSTSTQNQIRKSLDQQLAEQGWGCRVGLLNSKKLVWDFQFEDQDYFVIYFERPDSNSPWDLSNPVVQQRIHSSESKKMLNAVMDSIKYGNKYIYDQYNCEYHYPPSRDRSLPF